MVAKGACTNHPTAGRPAAWFLDDGSTLCDPCYFRQRAFVEIAEYLEEFPHHQGAQIAARLVRRYLNEGPTLSLTNELINDRTHAPQSTKEGTG